MAAAGDQDDLDTGPGPSGAGLPGTSGDIAGPGQEAREGRLNRICFLLSEYLRAISGDDESLVEIIEEGNHICFENVFAFCSYS